MKNTYRIAEEKRMEIEKKVARLEKKAEKYGTPLKVQYGASYATEIPVYFKDFEGQEHKKMELHEVFDLTIESEEIKKDGYKVLAKVEHMKGGNVVSLISGEETKLEWTLMKPYCQHCNSNHGLKVTFIVGGHGEEKQIGRTCLREYCGIDPQEIGIWNELNCIVEDADVDHDRTPMDTDYTALSIIDVLAHAIDTIKDQGYIKSEERDSNKAMIADKIRTNARPTEKALEKAEALAKGIASMDRIVAFNFGLDKAWTLVNSGYCKASHLGFVAYAPIAYDNYLKKMAQEAERKAQKENEAKASDYIGTVGDRITVDLRECKLLTSWENQYGYTYLYKMVDTEGNVLIWFASRVIGQDNVKRITATVKDHNERESVKQTIVTRCKVVA